VKLLLWNLLVLAFFGFVMIEFIWRRFGARLALGAAGVAALGGLLTWLLLIEC
jgi:hypothetical protein